jgi:hypothetical protein
MSQLVTFNIDWNGHLAGTSLIIDGYLAYQLYENGTVTLVNGVPTGSW